MEVPISPDTVNVPIKESLLNVPGNKQEAIEKHSIDASAKK